MNKHVETQDVASRPSRPTKKIIRAYVPVFVKASKLMNYRNVPAYDGILLRPCYPISRTKCAGLKRVKITIEVEK